jgi:cell division protein FtsW (lipid II flippase)/uncharacterized membrane protein YhdT
MFKPYISKWKRTLRRQELKLLFVVALYTLTGFFLVNAGLSLDAYGELQFPAWLDWFVVALAFVGVLFTISLVIFPLIDFEGDQLILPLTAFLCATGLLVIAYLEPALFEQGVQRFVVATAAERELTTDAISLYEPISLLEREEFEKLNADWVVLNAENAEIRDANLCDTETPTGTCPPVQAPLDWHYYLYDHFANILVGLVILLSIIYDPPPHRKPWFRVPRRAAVGTLLLLSALAWALGQQQDVLPASFGLLGLDGQKMLFAVVAVLGGRYLNETLLRRRWVQAGIGLIGGALLVITFVTGNLSVPVLNIQVSELIKLLLVVFFAGVGSRVAILMGGRALGRQFRLSALFALAFGAIAITMFRIYDLGAILILATVLITFLFLLLPARTIWPLLLLSMILVIALGALGYYVLPAFDIVYVKARIDLWQDPWADTGVNIDGEQLIQALRALRYGGLTGQGLGQGRSYVVPAAHTDMLFAVIIEQVGWLGGLLVIAAYVALILRGFRIALGNYRAERILLAAGLTAVLGFQTLIIFAGTVGALPLTGITVPLISKGGTSLLLTFAYLGFLLRLSVHRRRIQPADRSLEIRQLHASLPHLAAFFLIIFPVAAGVGIGRVVHYSDRLTQATEPLNPWIQVELNRTLRGAILDRHGNPIAHSLERGGDRVYPDPVLAESLAQTVGFDSGFYGTLGLEHTFNDYLNGRGHDSALMAWFARLRYILTQEFDGQDVQTTLDPDLQKMVYGLMSDPARVSNAGAALLMEPTSGEIRAIVSIPTFDPALIDTIFESLNPDIQPLVNRATQGQYTPGSVFKILTAAAALDTPTYGTDGGLITPDYMFYFNDDLQPPPGPAGYNTWWHEGACAVTASYQGFGNFDFAQALAYSDNVVFAQIGQALGPFRFREYAEAFGIGQTYEIGIEVAPSSLVRDSAYLETPCGLAQTAFGQGQLFVTPLQIAMLGATVANDGELPYPRLVSRPRVGEKGWRVISKEAADQLTEMMVTVTEDEYGSGLNAQINGVHVAGKTGTAQVNGAPHAWFVGFAPAEDPQYLAVVVLEHQGEGSQWAAPLVRDILANALSTVEQP